MPDCEEFQIYVQGDNFNVLFEIESLQQLLREEQKHVQILVTGIESKLIVRETVLTWERLDIGSNDEFRDCL